ncbi:tudor domain-containing protein 7, partial [Plakobranchus ocellatus]
MTMDEEKKRALFEQVKIELRSILLSSKDGVPEHLIQSDYEMLSCQRLPYRELGYKSVSAFLKDMPDVAKEIRLASGEVFYKAVSNESTAHIQKLVGNQKSAKKRVGRGRGRGGLRGRGGTFRGSISRGGRGGRGGSVRGSFTPRGSFTQRGARASSNFMGDVRRTDKENKFVHSFKSLNRSSTHSFAGDVRSNINTTTNNNNNYSKGIRNTNYSEFTADVRNKDRNLPITNSSGQLSQDGWEDAEDDYYPGSDDSPSKPSIYGDKSPVSPMVNLRIGLANNGQRKIVAGSPIMTPQKHSLSNEIDSLTPGGQIDLRGWLNNKQKEAQGKKDNSHFKDSRERHNSDSHHAANERKKVGSNANTLNKELFKKDLPPRFLKQQQQQKSSHNSHYRQEQTSKLSKENNAPMQVQKALHTIGSENWSPPENGPRYVEAYYNYFAGRGEIAPLINVVVGKVNHEKGFYGQIQHEGTCHFPLDIQRTAEQAKQNAARSFCITNQIP